MFVGFSQLLCTFYLVTLLRHETKEYIRRINTATCFDAASHPCHCRPNTCETIGSYVWCNNLRGLQIIVASRVSHIQRLYLTSAPTLRESFLHAVPMPTTVVQIMWKASPRSA